MITMQRREHYDGPQTQCTLCDEHPFYQWIRDAWRCPRCGDGHSTDPYDKWLMLGRELIEWAAEEANVIVSYDYHGEGCIFCDYMTIGQGDSDHAPDCLHLRAQALYEGEEKQE